MQESGSIRIRVRVVYALADRQSVVELEIAAGTTVAQAVEKSGLLRSDLFESGLPGSGLPRSGLLRRVGEIESQPLKYAIFGRVVAASDTLAEGDRVEILRPLLVDPKEGRRQAAAQSRRAALKTR